MKLFLLELCFFILLLSLECFAQSNESYIQSNEDYSTQVLGSDPFLSTNQEFTSKRFKAPIAIGPQYFLTSLYTSFVPESAFNLKSNQSFFTFSAIKTNNFAFSENNEKFLFGVQGDESKFLPIPFKRYSIYIDLETVKRSYTYHYGFSDSIELSIAYEEVILGSGDTTDIIVESFHDLIGISNKSRDSTERSKSVFYIYDNVKQKNVFIISNSPEGYLQIPIVLGFKFQLIETLNEALSFKIKSSFLDINYGQRINEATDDTVAESKNFDDYNLTLYYSSQYENLNLHIAYSLTKMSKEILPEFNTTIENMFMGLNYRIFKQIDAYGQLLLYTSLYPISHDSLKKVRHYLYEYALGTRFHIGDSSIIELAVIENYHHESPENIDVSFLTNFTYRF